MALQTTNEMVGTMKYLGLTIIGLFVLFIAFVVTLVMIALIIPAFWWMEEPQQCPVIYVFDKLMERFN